MEGHDASPQVDQRSSTRLVTGVGQVLAVVAAAGYGLGLVVVNLHLSRYGYHSFNLVRTTYVAAGLWALLLLWAAAALLLLLRVSFRTPRGNWRQKLWGGLKWASGGLAMVFAPGYLLSLSAGITISSWFFVFFTASMLVLTLWNQHGLDPVDYASGDSLLRGLKDRTRTMALLAPLVIGSLLGFLSTTATLWGEMSARYAGGRPVPVVLALDSTLVSRTFLSRHGLDPTPEWTVECALLARETMHFVVVSASGDAAILIPNHVVRTALMSPTKTAPSKSKQDAARSR